MLPPGVTVHVAYGYRDMRKGVDGLVLPDQFSLTLSRRHRSR